MPLTRVRVQSATGEAADATIVRYDEGSLYRNNSLGYYEVAMDTIVGKDGGVPGTRVSVYASCAGVEAGGAETELGPSSERTWTINLGNCGPKARIC